MTGVGNKKAVGYTIVEVMIFLAISGVMFLIAALFINGKQASTQFTQGVNDLASQLQATIQEVSNGRFPALSSLSCTVSSGILTIKSTTGLGQGTNSDCVFLGKVMHFSLAGNAKKYEVIPVAGQRLDASGNPVTSLANAAPTAMYDPLDPGLNSLTVQSSISQNLSVSGMKVVDAAGTPHTGSFAFAFFTNPSTDAAASSLQNGAQTTNLYYVSGIDGNKTETNVANSIKTAGMLLPASGVAICFNEGTNRQAAIIIGKNDITSANSSQLSVEIDRSHGVTPCN
ncbi:MAG TPA: hypothetical protein VLG37_03455 [Candidatus Saccharimonadales bacterium]|nr:hypothetical protein [Candidatus Saccharimonadales bacterium]